MRACIGRPFAWQESLLTICLLFQNFNFRPDDPTYHVSFNQTLTIKPRGYYMYATLRGGLDPIKVESVLHGAGAEKPLSEKDKKVEEIAPPGTPKEPMTILFGSNTGTCESLAQSLASMADNHGYKATVQAMDAAVNDVHKDQPTVLITASYEGEPPDNAAHFMEWLQSLKGGELAGAKYSVFGCGHRMHLKIQFF